MGTLVTFTDVVIPFHNDATSLSLFRWFSNTPLSLRIFTSSSVSIMPFISSVYRARIIPSGAMHASYATRFRKTTSLLSVTWITGRWSVAEDLSNLTAFMPPLVGRNTTPVFESSSTLGIASSSTNGLSSLPSA
ncbi:uncharacterized protein LOC109805420 [Cajanus cajan]|uniref:uncharacterized protein LOC109805420 n=1 Tax=Cajanus cajan TaxID=3821 RepID=UPI00098DB8F0|nr:uncharacterized protein LOC109805420 [Cajanus cajan]